MKIIHKEQTDESSYNEIKKAYKQSPEVFINPNKWKKLQLIRCEQEGRKWSK